jgi:nucleoside-diphosphate-sugar epimerase
MKIVVIGGSGHIGTFLVPRLVRAGHEVVNLSRGTSRAYSDAPEWGEVVQVVADREREDRDGVFAERIARLGADAVIDLVCFTLDSATALVEGLRGSAGHLVHCGSVWRYGASRKLPIAEGSDSAKAPLDEYGIGKRDIADFLKHETASGGLVTTSLHPGHIVGPGWAPIGPLGNLDLAAWRTLAVERHDAAAGEDFNILAPTALSVRGYADIAAAWFGQTATLESVTWEQFREITTPEHADASWGHLHRSQCFTIEKAKTLLGYAPRYEPEQAVLESLQWLVDHGQLELPRALQA